MPNVSHLCEPFLARVEVVTGGQVVDRDEARVHVGQPQPCAHGVGLYQIPNHLVEGCRAVLQPRVLLPARQQRGRDQEPVLLPRGRKDCVDHGSVDTTGLGGVDALRAVIGADVEQQQVREELLHDALFARLFGQRLGADAWVAFVLLFGGRGERWFFVLAS